MTKALFLSMLTLFATPVSATDTGHCDATPFTLGKPATPAPKAEKAQPKAKPVTVHSAPKKPEPKAKATLLAPCKEGKSKKKSG